MNAASALHRARSTLALIKMQVELGGYPAEVLVSEIDEVLSLLREVDVTAAPPPVGAATGTADGGALAVLVVDDDPRLAEALARRLTREGLFARAECSLRAAIEAAAGGEVLILDLSVLAGASADELAWATTRRPIVITGASQAQAEAWVKSISPYAVLQKPFAADHLVAIVRGRAAAAPAGR